MSVTAEERPGTETHMDETVIYEPNDQSGSGSREPAGLSDMRQANPSSQVQGRYAFGSGSRPLDGYTIKRAIGRGGFGEVYYGTSDSGKEVALKLILRNLDVERRGVMQCMNLKCPNLLTIFDLKVSDAGDTFVIMEYVAGPSLASVLKQHPAGLPRSEVCNWLKGLVEGVAYLHDHGIVHRDLKPANLFMEEGIVKIGDYGLAKLITPSQGTEHSESIGTCHYMAPEIGSGKYNKPIDVYAIGVILYEMLTGRVPFDGETVNEVLMKHLTSLPDVSMLPEPYRTIVAKALAKDPNQRPSRVYDLLPAEDAPRQPEVRIIGDGKVGGARREGATAQASAQPEEDILRIEAEEPVFYIGPDTRPPRNQGRTIGQRLRANWQALRCPARYASPQPVAAPYRPYQGPGPRPGRAPAPPPVSPATARAAGAPTRRAAASTPPPAPAPPPDPPALPSGRVRFAELAASMLWSAPVLALLSVPAAAILGVDPSRQPQELAYLYSMALLGTWTSLIPAKLLETRQTERKGRRLAGMGIGLLTGIAAIVMALAVRVGSLTPQPMAIEQPVFGRLGSDYAAAYLWTYFAILYTVTAAWSSLAARDRKARFRLMPVLWTGALATALLPLWPFSRPDCIAIATMIAATVQLVSPWNKAAALYTRYVQASEKQKRKLAV
jgi:hypothetical protein